MTKMPDAINPTELLAAANPVASHEVAPERLERMITHVTSAAPASRFSLLRTWQMKAGSAVAAAALVVTGVVVSLGGTPQGLTVFAFASNTSVAGPAPLSVAGPAVFESTEAPTSHSGSQKFVAGRQLPSQATPLAVYSVAAVSAVANAQTAVEGVASALGVRHVTIAKSCSFDDVGTTSSGIDAVGHIAEVIGESFDAINCQAAPVGPITWAYAQKNSPCLELASPTATSFACPISGAYTEQVSHLKLVTWASPLVKSLIAGHLVPSGMRLAAPTFSSGTNIITYTLETNGGVITNQHEVFQFTNHGALLFATGLLAKASLDEKYPALSPAAAVALLQTSTASGGINPGGPMIPAPSSTTTINPGGPMIPAPSSTTTTTAPSASVTIDSATLSYQLVWLTIGSAVLVPQYTYHESNGSAERALALNPSYYLVEPAK
jgi:hypothetical protein